MEIYKCKTCKKEYDETTRPNNSHLFRDALGEILTFYCSIECYEKNHCIIFEMGNIPQNN